MHMKGLLRMANYLRDRFTGGGSGVGGGGNLPNGQDPSYEPALFDQAKLSEQIRQISHLGKDCVSYIGLSSG